MAGGLAVLIPAEFDLQFSFHPIFGLGQDAKSVDGLKAALVHDFVSPKELIDKYIAIIDANGLSEIANGSIVKGGFELNDVRFQLFIKGRIPVTADDVIDLAGLLGQGEPVHRLFRQRVEGPGTSFGGSGPGGGAVGGWCGDGWCGDRDGGGVGGNDGGTVDGWGPVDGSSVGDGGPIGSGTGLNGCCQLLFGYRGGNYFCGRWHHNCYLRRHYLCGGRLAREEANFLFE